jgi:dolichol-phosphate mannosyltransferase
LTPRPLKKTYDSLEEPAPREESIMSAPAIQHPHDTAARSCPGSEGSSARPAVRARTLVALATYNEIENLPSLVDAVEQALPDADILVVDDNSPDGTGRWCQERARSDPRLTCLHRPAKLGLGTATVAAMQYAIDAGYEHLLNMDADFSHGPRFLPALVAGMDERGEDGRPKYDVMIGSRYVAGGAVEGWPLLRRLMSRGVNAYARLLLGLSPRDCSGAFRCYRTAVCAKIDFAAIRSRGYSFQEEILWRLRRAGARFGETAITFVDRRWGRSKINAREALAALWIILRLGIANLLGR